MKNNQDDKAALLVAQNKLAAQETMVQELLMNAPAFVCTLMGPEYIYELVNDRYQSIFGKRKIQGKPVMVALPELEGQGFDKLLDKVYQTGETYVGIEIPIVLARDENLAPELQYFSFSCQPMYDENKQIIGILVFGYEVTPQTLVNKKTQENESHFRMIVELMPEQVTNATPDGTVVFYNKSWCDYTGASLDELINEGWAKWIHPDEVAQANQQWLQAVATGNDFEMEIRIRNHDGQYRWHKSRAKAVKDENRTVKLWMGFNNDIDNQKKQTIALAASVAQQTQELQEANQVLRKKNQEIEDSKEKLLSEYSRRLIEASLDPLIAVSVEGKITDMNEAWVQATGSSRKKITGTNFFDYFTSPPKAQAAYEQVFAKGFITDYPLVVKDHKLTDVLLNGSVYKDSHGKVLGTVIVARDMTEQKRVEKELIEAKVFAELTTVIAEQARSEAELAAQVAENAVKSKQQFLSNMSHEIRTPMNAIVGFTKVVLKTDLSAKQQEYLTAIKTSGDALIVLINDILDLAKVDAGKMTFEQTPFKMSLSIAAMLHLFETKIQEKNLKLIAKYDKNIPEVLLGDAVRLHQIILNLVSNAVKFTNVGTITVSVQILNQDAEQVIVEFSIADTGIGIPAAQLETIFGNFQQATSDTARPYGGTGLGLAIVKQLVEPQGGHIQVTSKLNEGSTFRFTLPFQKTQAEYETVAELMDLNTDLNKGIKVLVVEDMPLNQLLMKTLLDDFKFECTIAANGKLAIEKLQSKTYDIILMDLQMPEMNGFETTDYIRNTLKLSIPIIALTADVTTVDVAKCRAVGMNDYIAKPIDERILYSKIVSLVRKAVSDVAHRSDQKEKTKRLPCIDLGYLNTRTKANPKLMSEMISLYLEQTPPLISTIKQSFRDQDWPMLSAAVHKIIPSFAVVGISVDFENMAKKIQEYAHAQQLTDEVHELVVQLENICTQACEELQEELRKYK